MLYVFQPIPRTAGASFAQGYLTAAFGDGFEGVAGFGSETPARRAPADPPAEGGQRMRVIAPKAAAGLRRAAPTARHLTLVRDPVARLISAYKNDLRTSDAGVAGDFVEFALDPRIRDVQARTLLGEHYGELARLSDAQVEGLLTERFHLIGESEQLTRFIFALSRLASFPLALFVDRLRNSDGGFRPPDAEVLARICDFHRNDLRVHRLAAQLFVKRTAHVWTPEARRELEAYAGALEAFADEADGQAGQIWMLPPDAQPRASINPTGFISHPVWRPAQAAPTAGGARVSTGPAAWSYAAELSLAEALFTTVQAVYLRVDLRVEAGRIGLAVCAGEDRAFLSEAYFPRIRTDISAIFPIRRALAKPALLVRNAAEAGGPSVVEIKGVTVLTSAGA